MPERSGCRPATIAGDVSSPHHRSALVESARQSGSLDLLVNNASTLGPSPLPRLEHYPLAGLRRLYEVNVLAPLALVQRRSPSSVAHGARSSPSLPMLLSRVTRAGAVTAPPRPPWTRLYDVLAAEHPATERLPFDPGDMRTTCTRLLFRAKTFRTGPNPSRSFPLPGMLESGAPSGRYRAIVGSS